MTTRSIEHVAALHSLPLLRYPRTPHLESSRHQSGDAPDVQPLAPLVGQHAVIEEKMDGANCALSFTEGGELCLQSRGHYLTGGARERQFAALHPWARAHESALLACLQDRYVLYGEWMFAKHAMFYDRLPHYLLEFDVWDREAQCFFVHTTAPRVAGGLAGGVGARGVRGADACTGEHALVAGGGVVGAHAVLEPNAGRHGAATAVAAGLV